MDVGKEDPERRRDHARIPGDIDVSDGEAINVSGHKQELQRIFDPLSIISYAIASGNVWPALGGTIVSQSRRTSYSRSI